MSTEQEWTVGRLLTWTADFLKKHQSESPRLDAEVLLAEARGCQRIQLYTAFDEVVDEATRAKFRELVQRRSKGTPVAYLVGRKEFYSLSFRVTSDVLIPRPETEHAVIAVLDFLKSRGAKNEPVEIVDVGTGSGAIAVSIAKHAPHAQVLAVDISPAALEVAKSNAATHQVADRVVFRQSDLLAAIEPDRMFDVIVSNPPYVIAAEWADLEPSVRDYEPKLALVGGETGLEITARLVNEAGAHLRPGGCLILEIHSGLEAGVHQLLAADGRFAPATTSKDLSQLPRVVKALRV
ncbi:MAG TPA: peptide chain release factor N(5)-glutamine methyltransferase [Pirellulaceae bacterium]|nr:peptide chain release factor N(5)-glutamine methyltransferase [Pirellulaceae bacterium]